MLLKCKNVANVAHSVQWVTILTVLPPCDPLFTPFSFSTCTVSAMHCTALLNDTLICSVIFCPVIS